MEKNTKGKSSLKPITPLEQKTGSALDKKTNEDFNGQTPEQDSSGFIKGSKPLKRKKNNLKS